MKEINLPPIRHLSIENNYEYFLAAEFEKTVHIYQKGKEKKINTIKTNLDFGGVRLQLIPEYNLFLAGAYHRYGIEAYSIITGEVIWKRPDLKKVQIIKKHPGTNHVSCFFEGSAGQIIDVKTGNTLEKYRGVKDIYFNDTEEYSLLEKNNYYIKHNNITLFKIQPDSSALLDAVFADTIITLSESGKDLRFFSITDGIEIGRYIPQKGYHILKLIYSQTKKKFICLLWGYESNGDYFIIHINENFTVEKSIEVSSGYVCAFITESNSFINATGTEINYYTGVEIRKYDFLSSGI